MTQSPTIHLIVLSSLQLDIVIKTGNNSAGLFGLWTVISCQANKLNNKEKTYSNKAMSFYNTTKHLSKLYTLLGFCWLQLTFSYAVVIWSYMLGDLQYCHDTLPWHPPNISDSSAEEWREAPKAK